MTHKMKSTKVRTVTVLNVYKFRKIARICFIVESSDESSTYNTCFNGDAEHGSCTCDGNQVWHRTCYHVSGLKARAQAYFDSREPGAQPEPTEAKMAEMAAYYEKEAAIASEKNWKESSGFGGQAPKMEPAGRGGRLVPMR